MDCRSTTFSFAFVRGDRIENFYLLRDEWAWFYLDYRLNPHDDYHYCFDMLQETHVKVDYLNRVHDYDDDDVDDDNYHDDDDDHDDHDYRHGYYCY